MPLYVSLLISATYGNYALTNDYGIYFSIGNQDCPEVIMAFANSESNIEWWLDAERTVFTLQYWDYLGGTYMG